MRVQIPLDVDIYLFAFFTTFMSE